MIETMLQPLRTADLLKESEDERRIHALIGDDDPSLGVTNSVLVSLGGQLVGLGDWLTASGRALQAIARPVCPDISGSAKHQVSS